MSGNRNTRRVAREEETDVEEPMSREDRAKAALGGFVDVVEKLVRHTAINPDERDNMLGILNEFRAVTFPEPEGEPEPAPEPEA